MLKHFIKLEWKSFFRAASFQTNLVLKIFMVFGALYFMAMFVAMAIGAYFGLEKAGYEPLGMVNKFLIYYFVVDLLMRYFFQKMPVINIQPLLLLPFKKSKIVSYALGKTAISFFNIIHAFFFIPFSIVLIANGYDAMSVLCWNLGLIFMVYVNNFINVFFNNKMLLVSIAIAVVATLGVLQYYAYFDITDFTQPFFQNFYEVHWWFVIPLGVLVVMTYLAFNYFNARLYLDAGLSAKAKIAKTENLEWLDRFGKMSTFLKNDIKLIKRNKRSRTTVIMSVVFLFYGMLFFTGAIESYDNPFMKIFAGIFVSGGFLFSFGQFVPSWDSSYYPLMMTQNIRYREYLFSKWLLVVLATAASTVIAVFYLYFGWEAYAAVLVCGIYNMGVNGHLVLLGGAFIKTPIDLSSNKKAFGDTSAFNVKTLLITVPKLLLPIILYAIGHFTLGPAFGYILIAITGVCGFALRDFMFKKIENIYKAEKYKTVAAYKQKN
ncbi:MAG: hypothetical protein CL868_07025 [Cytophagaceae bacterium]|nr:hypothetical protein [Cytophagaceae bacterium]|tara:strand:- start:37575 stop:39044 length:1470 start_codon:yes stop_codon:yes gene_type:complete